MATPIKNVAIIGASGNFGTPITSTLQHAGFNITIISRLSSKTPHPPSIKVIHTEYEHQHLLSAFTNQDAVICVVGPGGINLQPLFISAAEAAGVRRFIVDDFGWGPEVRGLPEFDAIQAQRQAGWDFAKARAEANPAFTWTGVTSGNPIDWAMKKFPLMGFDIQNRKAIIYDSGTSSFTGTTLSGIGQSVLGVLQHPDETANRFVKVLSLVTTQNELLRAFEKVTGQTWEVERNTTQALLVSGREKCQKGESGWILDLVVAQLFEEGQGVVAGRREETDSELLGVREESAEEVVSRIVMQA